MIGSRGQNSPHTYKIRLITIQEVGYIQGEAQKCLDNCYKTQITSYMDMIYFYSSKYIPP